jgi:hypothetical protein
LNSRALFFNALALAAYYIWPLLVKDVPYTYVEYGSYVHFIRGAACYPLFMMSLRNRIVKLERAFQARVNDRENVRMAAHDQATGDNLLRIWEGADDWVQRSIENTIANVGGLNPEARENLQQRLRILKSGAPVEILFVLACLSRNCPGWSSPREEELLAAALRANPEMARAAAEEGILRAGRTDWRAYAWFLERRFPNEYGRNPVPREDPNQPKIVGARFSLGKPDEDHARKDSPLIEAAPGEQALPT